MALIRSHASPWWKTARWTPKERAFLMEDPATAKLLSDAPASASAPEPPSPFALPDPSLVFERQPTVTLLAILIWGEARGCAMKAKLAVGCVVRNRVLHSGFPKTFPAVILQRNAFSCFRAGDPNRAKLLHPADHEPLPVWNACALASYMIIGDKLTYDPSDGAHYYHDNTIACPPKDWGRVDLATTIGPLTFYRQA